MDAVVSMLGTATSDAANDLPIFSRIPTEILLEVTSYLEIADLLKLTAVSKRSYAVATPQLYKTIIFKPWDFKSPHPLITGADGDAKNPNLRHVRTVGIKGLRNTDALDGADTNVFNYVYLSFLVFLNLLEPGSIVNFINYLAEYQPNINSIYIGFATNTGSTSGSRSGTWTARPKYYNLANRPNLTDLTITRVDTRERVILLLDLVLAHRDTLKHLRLRSRWLPRGARVRTPPTLTQIGMDYLCRLKASMGQEIHLTALQTFEAWGLHPESPGIREARAIFTEVAVKADRLRSLKLRDWESIETILWPSGTLPPGLSILHILVTGNVGGCYEYLGLNGSLIELALVLIVEQDTEFPNLAGHTGTLRRLFMIMVNKTLRKLPPMPVENIKQLMEMPFLEHLAITLKDPEDLRVDVTSSSFPSLRYFWALAAAPPF
ncbi:hypothetical protein Dda_5312 [Drechslerella dactyloides]|uniref:F-box domain-containing protein n=1 Tax=Drechslerella dactyloides TaxID=74499 RepID=A0AAD6NIK4_DREDA|nr:hypothetical protein Dda_5312 [Drechslerella dactyloides]